MLYPFELPTAFVSTFLFIFGICIGSFLNVLIDRLPNEESIMGRSHCAHCKHQLSSWDLFPVVSFIFLKGKCRYCKGKIPSVLPFIEILTGVLFIITFFTLGSTLLDKILFLGIISCLIVVFFADAKYQIIPDSMHVTLVSLLALHFIFTGESVQFLISRVVAGGAILSPILFLYLITKGRGMGFADVKFAFVMGLMLGVVAGFIALYVGFILGAVVGIILIVLKRKKLRATIAFGPFLVLGTALMLWFGDMVLQYVRQWYGI